MNAYCNVRPRYTGGSPAMVNRATAARVARDERDGHARTLTGIYGADEAAKAAGDSLRGIAEQVEEQSDCWIVVDLITAEVYARPFAVAAETPLREGRRLQRLRTKYALPLESDLPTTTGIK